MNRSRWQWLCAAVFALTGNYGLASAQAEQQEDYEARFGALRTKVAELKPHEEAWIQERIEKAAPNITACPPGVEEPTSSRAGIGLDGVDYLYANPSTTEDEQYYCFYLVKPLHRALTVDEARDFSAAMMMPSIPHFLGGQPTAAQISNRAAAGEKNFTELRQLLSSTSAEWIDVEDGRKIGLPNIGDLQNLADCSHRPIKDLEEMFSQNQVAQGTDIVYNDSYSWKETVASGARCIFMTYPFGRGLSVDEARAFLTAIHLKLGMSKEMKKNGDFDDDDPRKPSESKQAKKK